MQDLLKLAGQLNKKITDAMTRLQIAKKLNELDTNNKEINEPAFWSNVDHATNVMKRQSQLEEAINPWIALQNNVIDAIELIKLDDNSLFDDLSKQIAVYEMTYAKLRGQLRFAGVYDNYDAIVSIYAGAGGTDAQDWAQMLMRMYIRWAEDHEFRASMIEESIGEEAGIKSATFEVSGDHIYGRLKGEHGVHRLVRLSPYNADNLRQTSFAKIEILPKIDKPDVIYIDEKDIKIDVFRSGGRGGQSVNTTDSAVRVTHLATGIVIVIQNERSQLQNKDTAMTLLRSKLAQLQIEQHKVNLRELKGPIKSAEWGNQIRNYVLHPYKQVKDLRTKYETSDTDAVLNGNIDQFIDRYLDHTIGNETVTS